MRALAYQKLSSFGFVSFRYWFLIFAFVCNLCLVISNGKSARHDQCGAQQSKDIRNFLKQGISKDARREHFNIPVWGQCRNVSCSKSLQQTVKNQVCTATQRNKIDQFIHRWSFPNQKGGAKANDCCSQSKVKQHGIAGLSFNHNFVQYVRNGKQNGSCQKGHYPQILRVNVHQGFKSSAWHQNNKDTSKSSKRCQSSLPANGFLQEQCRHGQNKQGYSLSHCACQGQGRSTHAVAPKRNSTKSKNSPQDVESRALGFKSRFSFRDHDGDQCDRGEEKAEKRYLHRIEALPRETHQNVIHVANQANKNDPEYALSVAFLKKPSRGGRRQCKHHTNYT